MSRPSRYIAPIDGMRAIAVIAVLVYHLGVNWLPGGFLGVDLFFVISGYVITRLILESIQHSGGLDLREFYLARVRRLFPALLTMIATTLLAIALFAPDAAKRFLTDIPFVLTGTNNWRLVGLHQDYFQSMGRPPLLQHTWSLSVEAQFYLIWPLVLLAALRWFGRSNIARVALGIALGSGLALFFLSLNIEEATTSRVSHIYFGSDTHSLGLFLGAALAVSWAPINLTKDISQRAQDFVDFIGVIGLLGLLATFLFIDETNPTLYRIAFPLAAIFGCAILTSLVHPASRFAPLVSSKLFLWIGERSYGIYLWHWVVLQLLRPNIDLRGSEIGIGAVRILVTFALADLSLRYIEIPIRRGEFAIWLRGLKYRTKKERRRLELKLYSLSTFIALVIVSSTALAWNRSQHLPTHLVATLASDIGNSVGISEAPEGIWLTGDSVILGIKNKLAEKYPLALVNARVGRQIGELIEVVKNDQPQVKNSKVVLDIGNNNKLSREDLIQLFELLKNQPKIVVVNTAVPRGWREDNDRLINEIAANYSQAIVVDWNSLSTNHPEFFASDGVHLNDEGGKVYVAAILEALK